MADRELNYTKHDISVETYREYVYPDDNVLRISGPDKLFLVGPKCTHRVVDKGGVTHRPQPGYLAIRWKQSNGKPFEF